MKLAQLAFPLAIFATTTAAIAVENKKPVSKWTLRGILVRRRAIQTQSNIRGHRLRKRRQA
jgi:hypothetical protein